jgi:hypothetical protein
LFVPTQQLVWLSSRYVAEKLLPRKKKTAQQHGGRRANRVLQIKTIAATLALGLGRGYNRITLEKFVK